MPRGRRAVARRPVEWIGAISAPDSNAASANTQFILLTAAQLSEYIRPTIVRIRGTFWARFEGTLLTGNFIPSITIGITVVTDQAAAAAATPIAFVDLDADWMHWDVFAPEGGFGEAASDIMYVERVIDTKAMRRIEQPDNANLILSLSTTFEGGGGTIKFRFATRILIKGD